MSVKKILFLALACLTVASFASCKKAQSQTQTTPGGTSNMPSEEGDPMADLPDANYDGYNFRILIRPNQIGDQYIEEETGDTIEDAIYKRNQQVQDRYNITITATGSSNGNYETDALNSILAGDDAYDAIFTHSRAAFSYAVQGSVENYNDIDAIDLSKPWWSKDIIESCDINDYLYVLDGDISIHRLSNAMCMYFNKRIFDELGLEYPYQMVRDGEWTFDEFERLVKLGAKDLNGDGVMNPEDDQFGLYVSEWNAPIEILYTGGQRIYQKDDNGIPQLTLNSAKTVDIFDYFFDLVDSDSVFLHLTNEPSNYKGADIFKSGRAMFANGGLGSAKGYRDMDDDFGIIPFPIFDDDDVFASVVNGYAHLMVVPITVSDLDRTGTIIEALAAYGNKDVIPAFYDVSLKTKFARDTDSEEMMDIIKDSIIYDLGYVSGGTFQSIGRDLARTSTHDFSSVYAANEAAALTKLKEFNLAYGDIED